MPKTPIEVVQAILADPTNMDVVKTYVNDDATYVSLTEENAELKKILPWAGTSRGPAGVVDTFVGVGAYWTKDDFQITDFFASGENVAVFGSFTYTSKTLGKSITSPFSMLCKVADGRVSYMQFMEDTFGTTSTFRSGGVATYRSNPDGGEVEA